MLASVSPLIVDNVLYERLATRSEFGQYKASIVSTDVGKGSHYIEEDIIDTANDDLSTKNDDDGMIILNVNGNTHFLSKEELMDRVQAYIVKGNIDLDKIMASATHAIKSRGIDADHLYKVWKIDMNSTQQTIETTSQNSSRTHDPKLS